MDEGFDCLGVDIVDVGYPARLIKADIRGFHPRFSFDCVIGSPPCEEFSVLNYGLRKKKQDVAKGLELIDEFLRVATEAEGRVWLMENVTNSEKWIKQPIVSRFKISKMGKRTLYGNMPKMIMPYRDNVTMGAHGGEKHSLRHDGHSRALIPYGIARYLATQVREELDRR